MRTVPLRIVLAALLVFFSQFVGATTFSTPPIVPIDISGYTVVADFNHDGREDVAVVSTYTIGEMQVLLNNGDGTYRITTTYLAFDFASGVLVGDFNHDGLPDVAIANPEGSINVLLGNGDGTFAAAVSYDSGGDEPEGFQVGDIDGDHNQDLIVSNFDDFDHGCSLSSTVAVLHGNTDGTFSAPAVTCVSFGTYGQVNVGDFNSDGKTDVAVAAGFQIAVFLNTHGTLSAPVYYQGEAGESGFAVGDVNNDGRVDFVIMGSDTANLALYVVFGNGDGTFESPVSYPLPAFASGPALVDVNGDGNLDVLAYVQNGTAFLAGNGDGTFQNEILYNVRFGGGRAVADLNGDGKLDIAGSDYAGVVIGLGNGDGSFQAPVIAPLSGIAPMYDNVLAADFNGDGKADAVAADMYGNQVSVFLSNGDGTLRSPTILPARSPCALVASDLNGDGKMDLVVANNRRMSFSAFMGNGDGTFQPAMEYRLDLPGISIAAADFNGDGMPDLAVIEKGDRDANLVIAINDGHGRFAQFVTYPTTKRPSSVDVGDFNGDGKMDLALSEDGSTRVFLGNGDGTFQSPLTQRTSFQSGTVKVADLNNNGAEDIVVAAFQFFVILPGRGDGTFLPEQVISQAAYDLAIRDFNGDGRLDVATADYDFSVAFQTPSGKFKTVNYGTGAFRAASGDFNGDGLPDVVLNVGSGLVVLLNAGNAHH